MELAGDGAGQEGLTDVIFSTLLSCFYLSFLSFLYSILFYYSLFTPTLSIFSATKLFINLTKQVPTRTAKPVPDCRDTLTLSGQSA